MSGPGEKVRFPAAEPSGGNRPGPAQVHRFRTRPGRAPGTLPPTFLAHIADITRCPPGGYDIAQAPGVTKVPVHAWLKAQEVNQR